MIVDTCHSLAVKYLFLTNDGLDDHTDLVLEPFNATTEQNDYEVRIEAVLSTRLAYNVL